MVALKLFKNYKQRFWNKNLIVTMALGIVALLVWWRLDSLDENALMYAVIILAVLFLLAKTVGGISFFSKYEHTKEYLGDLRISASEINWHGEAILWTEVSDIQIRDDEIEGKREWGNGPQNNLSDGINKIELTVQNGKTYKGWYQLSNKHELQDLKAVFLEAIILNKLDYQLAKKLMKPASYQEHQELKQKIAEGKS